MRYGKWKEIYKSINKREKSKIGDMAIAFRTAQYSNEDWEKALKTFY